MSRAGPEIVERDTVGRMSKVRLKIGAIVLSTLALTGCGLQVPADPEGTLDRVSDGVMRVGVTEHAPWVELDSSGEPSGTEPALVEAFAEQLDADVEWTAGSEAVLLDALDRGELDLVIGGFLDDTPWAEDGAITRPYRDVDGDDGVERHVMIVRMGENGFLVSLERFLHDEAEGS